jgi:3D (Asp-Asp-Asp) domain-containing protein
VSDQRPPRRRLLWLLPAAAFLLLLLPVVLIAGAADQCGPAGPPTSDSGHGRFEETVYGPPWGGIEGEGTTAYGIDLRAGQPMLEIAIDPAVLQPRAYYHVWPNPFRARGAFLAGDTGGAIKGLHIDTYDWLGRSSQDAWGVRYGVSVTKAANPGAANTTGQLIAPASSPSQPRGQCAQLASLRLAPGTYTNPFRSSSSITRGRIDMGVDYTGTGSIVAIGQAVVTYSQPSGAGWGPYSCTGGYGGAVVYQLTAGPDRGRSVYTAEGIIPTVTVGQRLTAGQPIATFTGCIEIGWASGQGDQPMAQALGQECQSGDPGCVSTACGENMSRLIAALGGPAGIPQGPIYGQGC